MNIILQQFRVLSLLVLFLLQGQSTLWAQANMTKIKDASIVGTAVTPFNGAVLELESNNKGFLAPRMTKAERDAIPVEKRTDGLLIFNTSTSCFNYWSSAMNNWLSLCGTAPQAVMTFSCGGIAVHGVYKQGNALDGTNFLSVPVTVQQPGTYEVTFSSENGYYFTTSGTFPSAGDYTLYLPGMGTPRLGSPTNSLGDILLPQSNGKPILHCNTYVRVASANVDYEMSCSSVSAEGNYMIGSALNQDNFMEVSVTVTTPGFWSMWTNTVNGYSFSGSGTFTQEQVDASTPIKVTLIGTGQPIASGQDVFVLSSNSSNATNSCSPVTVNVESVAYTMDCQNATVNGEYMQAVPTSSTNTILLPINVTALGTTTISTNTANGISFTSGPISLSTLGDQTITLIASGTPTSGDATTLTVTGAPGADATCAINIPIQVQPVSYTMTCGSIKVNGNYAPNVAMKSSNTMIVKVKADYGGTWQISTNTLNGVSFSGSGTLSAGQNTLTLHATGTPASGGSFTYKLTSNSSSSQKTCSQEVSFVYRKMNILGLGKELYQIASAKPDQASRAIPQVSSYFGPKGTVKINDFNIVNGGGSDGNKLISMINDNHIDIIIIGYAYKPNAASRAILADFVKNKKGVLIHAQENEASHVAELINLISEGNVSVSGTGTTYYNPILNVNDPIINGPFKDLRGYGSGSDVNNSYYVTSLPTNLIPLAHQDGNATRVHILRHATLGYMYVGDAGWTAGNASSTSKTTYPAAITASGALRSKSYDSGKTVYNSYLYANALAWAIKYVEENTNVGYLVK